MLRQQIRSAVVRPLEDRLDAAASAFLDGGPRGRLDFTSPAGEASFSPPDSLSWRIFKNPVALFVGGVTAVLLEFADPRVRTGVFEHSTFRKDPVGRLRRTGLAAMVTVYGARSVAERMIDGVRRMHDRVEGVTPGGVAYRANDPELLNWVHATASFGFVEAYSAYVSPLSDDEKDRYYREGQTSARAYGAVGTPTSANEQRAMMAAHAPRFERSDMIFEFIDIMRHAKALPPPLQISQRVFIRAAINLLPGSVREALALEASHNLRPFEELFVRRMGRRADRLMLRSSPAVQASLRLGLPATYLYPHRRLSSG